MKSKKAFLKQITVIAILSLIWLCEVRTAHSEVIFGNPKGNVTMIEYFDYNCPVCRSYAPFIGAVASKNPDLKVIQRVVPVLDINSSQILDRAVLASYNQGKFAQIQDAILHVSDPETISPGEVFTIAKQLGLDQKKLIADMQSKAVTQQLIDNIKSYESTNQTSVPVMVFYNNSDPRRFIQLNGKQSLEQIQNVINQLKGVRNAKN